MALQADRETFYLQSRGLEVDDAATMIVGGFIALLVKKLPWCMHSR